jgi:hypothetical protein
MGFRIDAPKEHSVVTLEQDGDDVNIRVNGEIVAWFDDETGELLDTTGDTLVNADLLKQWTGK